MWIKWKLYFRDPFMSWGRVTLFDRNMANSDST